jgi:hypothetical protein
MRELFLPSKEELRNRSGQGNPESTALLYARQVLGGIAKRLSLH